jgi:hypothetical protein
LAELEFDDPRRIKLLEKRLRMLQLEGIFSELEGAEFRKLSKGVREGETVNVLRQGLREIRKYYRDRGWSAAQIRERTEKDLRTVWEWIDRIIDPELKKEFLEVHLWEDKDEYIFQKIATLYEHSPHLRTKPSSSTVRDWRKAYLGFLNYGTPDGRRPKSFSPQPRH